MDVQNYQLVKRLAAKNATIIRGDQVTAYPAFPNGDMRNRPVSWVSGDSFEWLLAHGYLERDIDEGRYKLARSALLRMNNPNPDRAHADQHRDMFERDIYIPEGSVRSARFNAKLTPLRRLARHGYLTDAEIEAGERFAHDFAVGARGEIATQNYQSAGTGGTKSAHRQEEAMSYRIDARKQMRGALDFAGPGLACALTAVLGQEWSLEKLERSEAWSRNSGKTVLKLALQRLVEYYGTVPGV